MIDQPVTSSLVVDVTSASSRGEQKECDAIATLDARRSNAWHRMDDRMEHRRRDWEARVSQIKRDFFQQPKWSSSGSSTMDTFFERRLSGGETTVVVHQQMEPSVTSSMNGLMGRKMSCFRTTSTSTPQFLATFDMSQFQPNEITVRTDENRHLIIHGRQHQRSGPCVPSPQFFRQIEIPRHVDPTRLHCTFTNGLLKVELDNSASSLPAMLPQTVADSQFNGTSNQLTRSSASNSGGGGLSRSNSGGSTGRGSVVGPIVTDSCGNRRFRVSVDIGCEYLPNELSIKTVDRKLYLSARHDEVGPGLRTTSREMSREFELPDDVDPESVTANLTEYGELIIDAPINTLATFASINIDQQQLLQSVVGNDRFDR